MTNYILHVSLLLGLGFILYQVLLKKETFYSLNRIILSSFLILAFSLPLIHIPQSWSLNGIESFASNVTNDRVAPIAEIPSPLPTQKSVEQKVVPAVPKTQPKSNPQKEEVLNHKIDAEEGPTVSSNGGWIEKLSSIHWSSAFKWIYLIGLGIFFINFLVQFSILIFYRIKFPTLKDGKLTIVEMEGDKAPFSFLNMIYINPSKYDYDTYEQILAHEKIHITKWHSFDIFLSEIALIVLWFNPFAWLYRKVVEHNLEYLTDQEMLASGANAEVYQMNLLKVSVPELPLSLSTNYNQSFLKKRIHMMNAKKSSARSTWKYLFILPILGLSVTLFNPTFVTGQTNNDQQTSENTNSPQQIENRQDIQLNLDPNVNISEKTTLVDLSKTNANLEVISSKDNLYESIITDLSMFDIDKSTNLSVSQTDEGFTIISDDNQKFSIQSDEDKVIIRSAEEDILNDGIWEGEIKNNTICLFIKKGGIGKNYFWSSSECFLTSDFSPKITKNGEGEFSLTRDPGTLVLKGEFTNGNGTGRYAFTPNTNFIKVASNEGYSIQEKKLIHFFLSGIDADYFKVLKSNGYTNLSDEKLLSMAIHNVNEEFIMDINGEFKKANYGKPSAEELIALKIHDVDMEYVKSFGKELYEDLTVDQIIAAAIHDVEPEFIGEFKALGYSDLTFDNLISAAIHDVDVDYVKELKNAGFDDLTFNNLINASIHDVDPKYIKKFKDAGFENLTFDDMITASIHDVDPDYIKAFERAGMKVGFNDLVSASIHDIDIEYIKEFQEAGFKDLTFDNLISAGIHDVDINYLSEARSYGFDLSFDQLISSAIHDVDLSYLKEFSEAGFEDLDFDDMINASIHDVDPKFVTKIKALGYDDITFDNIISAAIHDVDINLIKGFKDAGFTDLSFDNFITASIHDVDPDFVMEVKNAGMSNISFDDIIKFGIHDIDIDDIQGLKDLGFDLNSDEMIEAGIHDVTPRFIKRMQEKGYKDLSFDEYVKLKIHGF